MKDGDFRDFLMIQALRATVLGGGAILVALENTVVIGRRGKADLIGNLENTFLALRKELFAFADTDKIEIFDKARAARLLEKTAEIGGIELLHVGDLVQGNVL